MKRFVFYVSGFLVLFSIGVSCQEKKTKSSDSSIERIFDNIGLLTLSQKDSVYGLIQNLETEVGSQIAIVIVDTLWGRNINSVSLELSEKLGLGREKYKDGLLIFIAFKNHQMRIEVGYGLEGIVKDEIANRIIKEKMTPRFREQKYYKGISVAVLEINQLIRDNRQLIGKHP